MKKVFFLFTTLFLFTCFICNNSIAPKEKVTNSATDSSAKAIIDTATNLPDSIAQPLPAPDSIAASERKYIYLTFDDGPLYGSNNIDKIIRAEKINTDVFVVGMHAMNDPELLSFYQLYQSNPYVEIGNHSYTHANNRYKKYYQNPDGVVEDFMKCESALQIPTRFARQPGRNQWRLEGIKKDDIRSGTESADLLYENGFKVFGWDVEWQHYGNGIPTQTVDQLVRTIEQKLDNGKTVKPGHLIILTHDEMFRTKSGSNALQQLIEKLKATGKYRFEHLSKYPA